ADRRRRADPEMVGRRHRHHLPAADRRRHAARREDREGAVPLLLLDDLVPARLLAPERTHHGRGRAEGYFSFDWKTRKMEQPGSGTASPRPLIIERPDLQSRSQRLISTTLTTLFWALWIYLWLPAVALLGWWLGVSRFYEEMVRLEGYRPLVELLGWYAICI